MSVLEQKVKQICNHPDHLVFFTESAINTVTRKVLHRGMAVMNAISFHPGPSFGSVQKWWIPIYIYIYIHYVYDFIQLYIYYVII